MNNCYLECLNLKTLIVNSKVSTKNKQENVNVVVSSYCFPVVRWQSMPCPRSCCGQMEVAVSPIFVIWPSCSCSEPTTAVPPPASMRRCLTVTRYSHSDYWLQH